MEETNPRLIAIAGPIEGAFFALPDDDIGIGSHPSNLLAIDDPSVFPRHAVIEKRNGLFSIRDLGAEEGTIVNGLPVSERPLVHGDEIRIGDCLFLFLVYEAETPPEIRLRREVEWLEMENRRLQTAINIETSMVGDSDSIRGVYRFISKVAQSDSTVLICGESGTGKELVARAIHRNSSRAQKPFVAINAAALSDTLLESELFGHEKGAFTGAIAQKRGKLEVADGGTVFLDEIGELPAALQAKLLRVLQQREFERVGGTRTISVDIRILAATNRNLAEAVREGCFRQDLYYRLNVVSVTMPPLRERRSDIAALAAHFAQKYRKQTHRRLLGISREAQSLLTNYDWPGNVRELENAIERAVVLGSTEFILPEDLPETILETEPSGARSAAPYHEAVNEAKKQIVLRAFEQANGNFTEAANLLGLHPNNVHRLIRNLDLRAALKK